MLRQASADVGAFVDWANDAMGGLNGLIEDDDDNSCPAIYTGNLGWLPLLILMIYIFFFNLVRFEQCFLSRAFGESTIRQAI